jgi:hypothetical protein
LTPRLRKFALTAHITCSVGWLGAVAGFLALALVGLTNNDDQTVQAAYVAMDSTGSFVLVPLALASLLTGLVQSLGTKWGLFRHYWVVFKLLMNIFATVILLLYLQTLSDLAARATSANGDPGGLRDPSPVLHSGAALLLLVVATTLAVYKPRGMTRYGWRKQQEQMSQP